MNTKLIVSILVLVGGLLIATSAQSQITISEDGVTFPEGDKQTAAAILPMNCPHGDSILWDCNANSWVCESDLSSALECGNGIVEGCEECDDGNTNPGDGCSAICEIEPDDCPQFTFLNAASTSPTSARLTFTSEADCASISTDGSQFVIDNGLLVSSATCAVAVVDLVTSVQVGGTLYTVTVSNTVQNVCGDPLQDSTVTFSSSN